MMKPRMLATWPALASLVVLVSSVGAAPAPPPSPEAIKKQIGLLNEITGQEVIEARIASLSTDTDLAKALVSAGVDMAKSKSGDLNFNAAYILARVAQDRKEFSQAQSLFKYCRDQAFKLQSAFRIVQIYDDLYRLYSDNKKFDEAIDVCRDILELDAGKSVEQLKPFILERMIQALAKSGKTEEALKQADDVIARTNGNWYFVQVKAWVLREAGRNDDAIKTYLEVIDKLQKADIDDGARGRYADRVRYLLSGVFVETKQIDKAAEQLQTLMKAHPDDPTYLNDLGFIWADNDKNLAESEKLIRKAIELDRKQRKEEGVEPEDDKDNAAYLDSLGWVLFKLKKYDEAKKELLEAVKDEEGQHLEIYDHLADVHMALGEKAEAIAVWKKALASAEEPLSKRDQDRKKQIEAKLKAAEAK